MNLYMQSIISFSYCYRSEDRLSYYNSPRGEAATDDSLDFYFDEGASDYESSPTALQAIQ